MELTFDGKDSNQHQDLIDFSVLTEAEVSPIVSVGNGNHLSTVAVSTLPSYQSTMDVLTASMSQGQHQHRSLPMLTQENTIHLHQQLEQQNSIMVQSTLHHHTLSNHDHLQQHQIVQTALSQELQPQQQQTPQLLEVVELAVEGDLQEPVPVHEVIAITGTGAESGLPSLELEQCCICSANYEKPRRTFPQPDVNRLLIKLLEIPAATLVNGSSFFNQYIPICIDCTRKVKKYERLRNEMDVIKQDVVSSLTDSLLYIQAKARSGLDSLRQPFLNRWVNRQKHQGSNTSQPLNHPPNRPMNANTTPQRKSSRILSKDHYIKPTSIAQSTNGLKLGPWQLAGEVNIFTTDSAGNAVDEQQYVTAYVTDVVSANGSIAGADEENDYSEEMELNPKTGMFVSKKRRRLSPEKVKSKDTEVENGIKKKKQAQVERAKQHERPPYFCESCGRVFSLLKSLRCHATECTGSPTKPGQCSICYADFSESTWLDLKFHIDLAHANDCQLEKCRHCRIDFLPNTIEDHECTFESSGNPKAIKPHQEYKCDFCDKTYFHTNSLGNHVRRHHKGEQVLSCEICSRTFTTSAILKSHMSTHRTQPVGKSAHKCDVCGIFCSTSWGLKQHKTVHSGERQFQCEECGKKFRLFQAWKAHEVVHTRERNFSCQICGKLFSQHCTMQRHLKRHINPLPALRKGEICPICGASRFFAKIAVLKQHMLRKHPGTKEQFEVCRRVDASSNSACEMPRRASASAKSKSKAGHEQEQHGATSSSESDSENEAYDELVTIKQEGDSDIEEILEIRNSRASRPRDRRHRPSFKKSPGGDDHMNANPATIRSRLKRNSL